MVFPDDKERTGLLLSGGLDSSVLAAKLLDDGYLVKPFYIRSGLIWEQAELRSAQRYLAAIDGPGLLPLTVLDVPVADVYEDHWSLTGTDVPDAASPDEDVFLPGRNAMLILKAALWCQLNGIEQLALAPLGTSPFADAAGPFFDHLQAALAIGVSQPLQIWRPFDSLTKAEVMRLGSAMPLQLTFSCLTPVDQLHCGECNKCAERQASFPAAGMPDPTVYANSAVTVLDAAVS